MSNSTNIATLAGGCFWCLEAIYQNVIGVKAVRSGYSGGAVNDPSYEAVCSGNTGHAEVVQIEFDPTEIAFKDLLGIFFTMHDPTTLNRQGADVGSQYRSAVFTHDAQQKEITEAFIQEITTENLWDDPIVTEVMPLETFYPAEDYHNNYFENNPNQPYCRAVVAPKVAKFRKKYQHLLK